ncbi:MAG TPA: glycosyltransferase family 4 protein [Acidimicrobiia bacterium]|nr:glycosyltransferase family 4 protein [Acidimicrobiia bacterium]
MTTRDLPIAFVPPRYGPGVVGGAEAVVSEMAAGLAARGHRVEVLTTCARDHYTWANEFPAGELLVDGVTVRRFPAVRDTDGRDRHVIGNKILAGDDVDVLDQYRWINGDLRVPALYDHLVDHARDYRLIVFAPYMFWTTFAGASVAPDRTVVMPCLHDEPTAYLDVFRPQFEDSYALWFLSDPERALAERIARVPRRSAVLGAGVHVPAAYDPAGFRARHDLDGPFMLYAGRREHGKGWVSLLDHLETARHVLDAPLRLVTCGVGEAGIASGPADLVVDVGYLTDEERSNAMAAATAYVQPSVMESFSRTIMEAWLAGTLVVANDASAVVRWHCERSGAGLTYRDRFEFTECVRLVRDDPVLAEKIASAGRPYVLEHYDWAKVLDRVEAWLGEHA